MGKIDVFHQEVKCNAVEPHYSNKDLGTMKIIVISGFLLL